MSLQSTEQRICAHSVAGENSSASTATNNLQGMSNYHIIRHISKYMNRREQTYPKLQSIFYKHRFHSISNKWAKPKEGAKNRWVHANGVIRGI
jgi:hypothetical protein